MMSSLKHPNCVALLGVCVDPFCIVMVRKWKSFVVSSARSSVR